MDEGQTRRGREGRRRRVTAVSVAPLARLLLSSADHCCLSPISRLLCASSSAHPLSLPLFLHSFSTTLPHFTAYSKRLPCHIISLSLLPSLRLHLSLFHTHTHRQLAAYRQRKRCKPIGGNTLFTCKKNNRTCI